MPSIQKRNNSIQLAPCRGFVEVTLTLVLSLSVVSCEAAKRAPAPELAQASPDNQQHDDSDTAFEAFQTQKLLGVPVKEFPPPQGLTGFDELPTSATTFKFTVTERPSSGAKPRAWYENRQKVHARAPDGTFYEAYLGHDDP